MKKLLMVVLVIVVAFLFTGCATQHLPLIFTSYTSVGIKAAVDKAEGGKFEFGYHDGSIAIIPVVAQGGNGVLEILGSEAVGKDENGQNATHIDAYSVVAQFDVNTGGNPAAGGGINLGKTVATGSAAKVIADGIYYKLANQPAPVSAE